MTFQLEKVPFPFENVVCSGRGIICQLPCEIIFIHPVHLANLIYRCVNVDIERGVMFICSYSGDKPWTGQGKFKLFKLLMLLVLPSVHEDRKNHLLLCYPNYIVFYRFFCTPGSKVVAEGHTKVCQFQVCQSFRTE